AGRVGSPGPGIGHGGFVPDRRDESVDLQVTGQQNGPTFLRAQLVCQLLQPWMFVDGSDGGTLRVCVERTDEPLELRTEPPETGIGAVRDERRLAVFQGPLPQPGGRAAP